MLAQPLEDGDLGATSTRGLRAEWKWDGIRVQLVAAARRAPHLLAHRRRYLGALPDIVDGIRLRCACSTASCWCCAAACVAPFNDLQQRLNRKSRHRQDAARLSGARARSTTSCIDGGEDLRALPFDERRARLEAWYAPARPPLHRSVAAGAVRRAGSELRRTLAPTRASAASKG